MVIRRLSARGVLALALGVVALAGAGCGGDEGGAATVAPSPIRPPAVAPAVEAARGRLVAAREIGSVDAAQARRTLDDAGFPSDAVRDGVTAYELTYRTIDAEGRGTEATGLVAFPQGSRGPLPVAVYEHGTVLTPEGAPSQLETFEGAPVAALFASDGFAYAAPDYLGLGGGRGDHPYLHARSEATASLDLLRAMRELAADRGVELAPDVYVTGFSQGGQATMALGELLAAEPEDGIRVRALAPIGGPMDLSDATWNALFEERSDPEAAEVTAQYLAKALLAWNRLYDLFDAPQDVFSSDYAPTIEALVEQGDEAAPSPPSVEALLREDARERLREPDGALADVLRANDSCTRPVDGEVRIYQGGDDQVVVPANAERCRALLAGQGIDAEVVELGGATHGGSAFDGLPQVQRWFRELAGAPGR